MQSVPWRPGCLPFRRGIAIFEMSKSIELWVLAETLVAPARTFWARSASRHKGTVARGLIAWGEGP